MKRNVTMREIGRELGVSAVTVSKALGGKDGVSDAVRSRIVKKAQEMGYNYSAKASHEGRSYDVGVLMADCFLGENEFYASLYKKLVQQLAEAGCYAILEILTEEDERELRVPGMVQSGKVDAVIILGQLGRDYLRMITQCDVALVFLDFYDEYASADAVVSDSVYGSYRLTNHLVKMGHRKIGFVGEMKATSSIMDRYLGFYKSMMQNDLPIHPEWVLPDRDGRSHLIDIPLPKELPTAFVCNCDRVASSLVRQLQLAGLRVPEDVSVVGFDDFLIATLCSPPLTTFKVDQDCMAKAAVESVLSKLDGHPKQNGRVVIGGRMIYRDSVADLRREGAESR